MIKILENIRNRELRENRGFSVKQQQMKRLQALYKVLEKKTRIVVKWQKGILKRDSNQENYQGDILTELKENDDGEKLKS